MLEEPAGAIKATWTEEDTARWLELSNRMPARRPKDIFYWFCRNTVGVPLEAIFIRMFKGQTEVLLKRRPPKEIDSVYGDKLAIMGTMIRAGDVLAKDDPELITNPFRRPLERILEEAGISKFRQPPENVTSRLFPGDRGPVCQLIFFCQVPDNETPAFFGEKHPSGLSSGGWYPIYNVPHDIVEEHLSLLLLVDTEI